MKTIPTIYTCHRCGGPAFGVFCSYACWRIDRGLPTTDKPTDYGDAFREAHQAAPKIHASRRATPGLVALPGESPQVAPPPAPTTELQPATESVQGDWATWIDEQSPLCMACGDTGRNSKGGPCVPCVKNGRVPSSLPAPIAARTMPLPTTKPAEPSHQVPRLAFDRQTGQATPQLSLF